MLCSPYLLWFVDMPKGDIVNRWKSIGRKSIQSADINIPYRFAGARTPRGQMAGGNNGQGLPDLLPPSLCLLVQFFIVVGDSLLQSLLFFRATLARLA